MIEELAIVSAALNIFALAVEYADEGVDITVGAPWWSSSSASSARQPWA